MKIKELLEKYQDTELTEEQAKQIKDFLGIKESKKWMPKENEIYYLVDSAGLICSRKRCSIISNTNENDNFRIITNNCFKTEEEAEFRLEQIKVYNELKNFADENNATNYNVFDTNTPKYHILYGLLSKVLEVDAVYLVLDMGQIYFSSRELAEQAIKKVGADKIEKYLFGVE